MASLLIHPFAVRLPINASQSTAHSPSHHHNRGCHDCTRQTFRCLTGIQTQPQIQPVINPPHPAVCGFCVLFDTHQSAPVESSSSPDPSIYRPCTRFHHLAPPPPYGLLFSTPSPPPRSLSLSPLPTSLSLLLLFSLSVLLSFYLPRSISSSYPSLSPRPLSLLLLYLSLTLSLFPLFLFFSLLSSTLSLSSSLSLPSVKQKLWLFNISWP